MHPLNIIIYLYGILVYSENGKGRHNNIKLFYYFHHGNVIADNKPIKRLCNGFHKIMFYGHFITTIRFKILKLRDI